MYCILYQEECKTPIMSHKLAFNRVNIRAHLSTFISAITQLHNGTEKMLVVPGYKLEGLLLALYCAVEFCERVAVRLYVLRCAVCSD